MYNIGYGQNQDTLHYRARKRNYGTLLKMKKPHGLCAADFSLAPTRAPQTYPYDKKDKQRYVAAVKILLDLEGPASELGLCRIRNRA